MREVLFVSKPVIPPWNDGSKNIVRDLAGSLSSWRGTLLPARTPSDSTRRRSRFAPGLPANIGLFLRLMVRRRPDIVHFVFAPNRRSSRAGRFLVRSRRLRSIHTAASAPTTFDAGLLFADRTVVLSRDSERQFIAAGVPPGRLVRIPAPLAAVPHIERLQARQAVGLSPASPVVLFAGDLEAGGGAETALFMAAAMNRRDVIVLMACRRKTRGSERRERSLRERSRVMLKGTDVRWVGETGQIQEYLAASDVVVLPATSLKGKTDHPLVLLEAMAHGVPIVVSEAAPFEELVEGGGAIACVASGEAFGAAVSGLLDDTAHRGRIGVMGRAYVAREHAAGVVAGRYEALYEAVWSEC